jgi:Arc/MetJ-type ribon-helix-helix transcriptional regulator
LTILTALTIVAMANRDAPPICGGVPEPVARNENKGAAMKIEINIETERLVREEIVSGHFRSVDDLIVRSVHAWRERNLASLEGEAQENTRAAAARRDAGEKIRELRKGVTLGRPAGMSLREYAHIGHKY